MKSRRTGGQDVGTVSLLNISLLKWVGGGAGLAGVVAFSLYATAAQPVSTSKATSGQLAETATSASRGQHQTG